MIIISAVFTFILASLNAASLDLIEAQEALKIREVFSIYLISLFLKIEKVFKTLTRIYLKSRVLMTSLTTKPFRG